MNVVATATIAPLAGVLTLGDYILSANVYGQDGRLAGAILVALLALAVEAIFAGSAAPRGAARPRAARFIGIGIGLPVP